ncbi:MAG: hypothetical protein IJ202_05980 [Bacteroidales bacterium]|nr:hypothetical protein [Bacteroidales bacterium]MBQ9713483.1 hypothetical protein [Bacteroidales bacterium]MBR6416144.1 hypothetical protein [Bacteroidales bacterium]
MDAILTYVNGLDPVWQKEYADAVGGEVMAKRYRDWGTLKYLLRGIEKHIPSIENVFLLVSGDSQVPDWVNRDTVKVVRHKDIIPERFLPTFNSTTIEMFMHLIPELGEEFLYFNDDMFPVMDCPKEDFFRDGKAVIGFAHHLFAGGKYKKRVRNSDHEARRALGMKPGLTFVRPQHTCSPMMKSQSEAVYGFAKEEIFRRVSRLRTTENFNQYLFVDYLYYKGLTYPGKISNKHLSPAVHSAETIVSNILNPSTKMICINDVHMEEEDFRKYRDMVNDAFEKHFPEISRFERH